MVSTYSENINFSGVIEVDIDGELAQLASTGYRRLKVADTRSDLIELPPPPDTPAIRFRLGHLVDQPTLALR